MLKKCQVVMLPTNEKANIVLKKNGELIILPTGHIGTNPSKITQPQHLYITSDDEIKDGDYGYHKLDDKIIQITKDLLDGDIRRFGYRKVIATTDVLSDYKAGIDVGLFLPQPSQSFIKVFVREYNKGNVITNVMVEYLDLSGAKVFNPIEPIVLKVNLINEITIKKVKDSWTRQDHLSDINKCVEFICSQFDYNPRQAIRKLKDKWIEKNL